MFWEARQKVFPRFPVSQICHWTPTEEICQATASQILCAPLTPSIGTQVERRVKPLVTSCFYSTLRSIQFDFTLRA